MGYLYVGCLGNEHMNHQNKNVLLRLAVSVVLSALLCALLALCVMGTNTDDDWSISLFLSGRLPGSGLSLFLNAALSRLIVLLGSVTPNLNWFFVMEHLTAFAAFAALIYGALTWARRGAGLAAVGLVAAFALPGCISSSNYTFVAFLSTLAGGFILLLRLRDEGAGVASLLTGTLLMALGMCWRMQMFLLALPFLGIAAAAIVWDRRRNAGIDLRALVSPLLVVVVACGVLVGYDRIAWREGDWASWEEYNVARTALSDYPTKEYEEISGQLTELGVSENDYSILRGWASGDTDVLDTSLVQKVADVAGEDGSGETGPLGVLIGYVRGVFFRPTFFVPLAAVMLLVCLRPSFLLIGVGLELACALAACWYFSFLGRLPDRVEDPIWLYAVVLSVAIVGAGDFAAVHEGSSRENFRLLPMAEAIAGLVICSLGVAYTAYRAFPMLNVPAFIQSLSQGDYVADGPISTYLENNPECCLVVDTGTYTLFEQEYGLRYLPSEDVATRIVPLGGWSSGSPFRREQCEARGGTNPFEILLTGQNVRLATDEGMAQRVCTFLREHYDQGVALVQVDELGGLPVWRLEGSLS